MHKLNKREGIAVAMGLGFIWYVFYSSSILSFFGL